MVALWRKQDSGFGYKERVIEAIKSVTTLKSYSPLGKVGLVGTLPPYGVRPIALGRKSRLFAGSDGGTSWWETVASLLATAKFNDVGPFAYLKDTLERLTNGHPNDKLDDLTPWN